jgi:hypothetical protein
MTFAPTARLVPTAFSSGTSSGANIVWITDLVSPRPQIQRTPRTVAAGNALRKHGISDTLIAGGHGTTGKQADMAAILAPWPAAL